MRKVCIGCKQFRGRLDPFLDSDMNIIVKKSRKVGEEDNLKISRMVKTRLLPRIGEYKEVMNG